MSNNTARPTTHQGDLAKLPRALAPLIERPQWCIWRWTPLADGKWQKPPFMATQPQRHANCLDPGTWCDYATALGAVHAGHGDGISFVLTEADPFAAVDLDHCRDIASCSIDRWAQNFNGTFCIAPCRSYAEITPSGTGLRIWGLSDGEKLNKKYTLQRESFPGSGDHEVGVELFHRCNKILTVTGLWINTNPLANIDKGLSWAIVTSERRKADAVKAKQLAVNSSGFNGSGGSGHAPEEIDRLIREGVSDEGNRSDKFHTCVGSRLGTGSSIEDIIEEMRGHPGGIAVRYLAEGRLAQEVTRSAGKFGVAAPLRLVEPAPLVVDDPELADDPEDEADPELAMDEDELAADLPPMGQILPADAPPVVPPLPAAAADPEPELPLVEPQAQPTQPAAEPAQPDPELDEPEPQAQPAEPLWGADYDPELEDEDDLEEDADGSGPQFAKPKPLPNGLAPVKQFDMSFLPTALAPWIDDIAERMQCPPDYVAISAITALGSVIGRRVGIKPQAKTDWIEYANLWAMFIGPPGMMKSPAMQAALAPIHHLEAEAAKENEVAREAYKANINTFKLRQQVWASLEKDALKKGTTREFDAGIEPEEPKDVRYRTNDTTYEAIGNLLASNPTGLLIERDELVSLLSHLDREEQTVARGFYMSGWSGTQPYTFDRIVRGHLHVDAVCLSILGSTQPAKIDNYARRANMGETGGDGLLQRFGLAVWPNIGPSWKNVDEYPNSEARDRAWKIFVRMSELSETNLCASGACRGTYDKTPFFRFDDAALEEFVSWRKTLEQRLRSRELSPAIEGHFAKYRKLVPALALINHLADGSAGLVGQSALRKAIALSVYLESHAHRIYGAADVIEVAAAHAILARIRSGELADGFTTREVQRHGWAGLISHARIQAGLDSRDLAVDAAIALLAETWPRCFSVYERRRRPLKLRIHEDIMAMLDGAITPRELAAALRRYVRNRHYLWRMVAGATRIDLDGNPAGVVSEGEAAGAASQLAQILSRRRRAADATPTPTETMPPLEMPLAQARKAREAAAANA